MIQSFKCKDTQALFHGENGAHSVEIVDYH
jgi:hypothetical protein